MGFANPKIHMICGMCGNNKVLSYRIEEELDDEVEGKINKVVYISCGNCHELTTLDEVIEDEEKKDNE